MLNQTRAIAQKYGSHVRNAALVVGTLPLALAARAQTSDPFDAAVATISAKVTSYGGELVVLSAVAVGFWVAMKFIKKIPKAAG